MEAHILIPFYLGFLFVGIWPSVMFGLHSIDELIQGMGEPNPDLCGKFMRGDHF